MAATYRCAKCGAEHADRDALVDGGPSGVLVCKSHTSDGTTAPAPAPAPVENMGEELNTQAPAASEAEAGEATTPAEGEAQTPVEGEGSAEGQVEGEGSQGPADAGAEEESF